jgi:hypothetical protein
MSIRSAIRHLDYGSAAAAFSGVLIAVAVCAVLVPAVIIATAPAPGTSSEPRGTAPDFWAGS